jgi:hypothetical protein
MPKERIYCYICGEKVEVGKRFLHCQTKHGLFPEVPLEDKYKKKYTIMGLFGTKEDFDEHIRRYRDKYC